MKDLRPHVNKQVIVESDTLTVRARLVGVDARSITVRDATSLSRNDEPDRPMDGTVVFPVDRIAWIQVLG